jgi:glycosyltransferase involved in cell wall biosynthesis
MIKKAVTCHSGNRDSYELSLALCENNLLDKLITDFYAPDYTRKFIDKRFNSNLSSNQVISLWSNFILNKLLRTPYILTDKRLSIFAANRALKNNSNLFLSSYTAYEAFSLIKNNGADIKCLLFQLHPHPQSIRNIFQEEIKLVPIAKDSLLGELEMSKNEQVQIRLVNESNLADKCVVASSFTKETLIENGIPESKITVVPYGVDTLKFPEKYIYNHINGQLNIIFVGQMIQRKGLYYLLEAVKLLNNKNVTLTIVGRGSIDYRLIDSYKNYANILIKYNLSHSQLVSELHTSDVMILPSLVEGFGQVILEAMSTGLPVICTPNTAGRDLFISGIEGIVVPIRNIHELANKIDWCCNNKKELEIMGREAAKTARKFTWEKFRAGISNFYKNELSILS